MGAEASRVYEMIKDAGFEIDSTKELNELIDQHKTSSTESSTSTDNIIMKTESDLHPVYKLN